MQYTTFSYQGAYLTWLCPCSPTWTTCSRVSGENLNRGSAATVYPLCQTCFGEFTRCGLGICPTMTGRCSGLLSVWAFLGSFRPLSSLTPSLQDFTLQMLTPENVVVDSHSSSTYLAVHLRRSKTDPFCTGSTLHSGVTGDILCPVTAMFGHLTIHIAIGHPLFLFSYGSTLSWHRLVQSSHQALNAAGLDDSRFSGHSFRIGAATTAARLGLSDSLIQTMGRWKSSAFQVYIRTPWQQLAQHQQLWSVHAHPSPLLQRRSKQLSRRITIY